MVAEAETVTAAALIDYVRASIPLLQQATGCGVDRLRVRLTEEAVAVLRAELLASSEQAMRYPAQVGTMLGLPVFLLPEGDTPAKVEAMKAGVPLDHGLPRPA